MNRLLNRQSGGLLVLLWAALLAGLFPTAAQAIDSDGRLGDWSVGGLAYGVQQQPDNSLGVLNSKLRLGGSLVPQLEPYAAIRPWIGPGAGSSPTPGGALSGFAGGGLSTGISGLMGGVLIDVPLGSFVFTPSVGAGSLPSDRREGAPTTEFRSQLELGYEFDNKSRFSLGYSRIVNDAAAGDPAAGPNNVFGFYYRLPFGGP